MADWSTADSIVGRAVDSCYARGLNLTPLRRRVLEVVAASPKPVSALAIAERLSEPPRRLVAQGLYPALKFLMAAGLVRHVGLLKAYVCRDPRMVGDCSALLVCHVCGSVSEVASEPLRDSIEKAAVPRGFVPGDRPVEIEGCCEGCRPDPGR